MQNTPKSKLKRKKNSSRNSHNLNEINYYYEFNGPKGVEPTRFGDWEKNGRCSDFQ